MASDGPRVLHIWNTAGVASVIAKFMDREYGTRSLVITRKSGDPMGLTTVGRTYADGPSVFFARALLMARNFDLVHVHSLERMVPWLKRLYRSKPVIMHYHGGEIRKRWEEKREMWERADAVVFATPDLGPGAPERATYAPNPVDTDLFHPSEDYRVSGSGVSIRYNMDQEAEDYCRLRNLSLSWIERGKVPHDEMPGRFWRAQYFLDFRRRSVDGKVVECIGKAGLEALACGCRVVDWNQKEHYGLPAEHLGAKVAEMWHSTYARLLGRQSRAAPASKFGQNP